MAGARKKMYFEIKSIKVMLIWDNVMRSLSNQFLGNCNRWDLTNDI